MKKGKTREEMIEKIAKLLRLSESPNRHEAFRALCKAQELAAKLGMSIEDIDIEIREEVEEVYTDSDYKVIPEWYSTLATIVGSNFRCIVVYTKGRSGMRGTSYEGIKGTLKFVGEKSSVHIANSAFRYALSSLKYFWKNHLDDVNEQKPPDIKESVWRSIVYSIKKDYFAGFLIGITKSLRENIERNQLVVIVPRIVEDYVNKQPNITNKEANINCRQTESYRRGFNDGKASDVSNAHTMLKG